MLKSKWAHAEEEAPTTAPVKQEAASAAPAPPAVNVTYDATYADASLDSFAQTAGTDDLFFDDDMTPISQPVVEQSSTLGAEAPEFVPAPEQPPPTAAPPHHQHQQQQQQQQQQQHAPRAPREPRNTERGGRGRGRGRGEGRGRGRGGRGRGGPVGDIRLEEQAAKEELSRDTPAPAPAAASAEPSSAPAATNEPPADAPTGPSTPSTASVRGDRTLTGGSKRTRLTEAELSAKLASMRSKNEALASAHARAQADAAAAEAREQQLKQQEVERKKAAAEKQKAERKDRQQLMGERERNRQRKLNAQGGREWDLEKEEGFDGTGEERRRGAARGAYGGVAGVPRGAAEGGRELFDEGDGGEAASYRGGRGGRGRGGRGGRGGGGGGGRGDLHDRHDGRGASKHTPQPPPAKEDFPSLPPSSSAPSAPSPPGPRIQEFNIKGKGDNTPSAPKNQDIRKHDPELKRELDLPAEPKPKTAEEKVAPRPEVKKMESFGLEPLPKGQSWADDE